MANLKVPSQYASKLPLTLLNVGKVRETFAVDKVDGIKDECIFVITSDRISALDVVLKNIIPGKGIVLNQTSNYMMEKVLPDENHLVDTDIDSIVKRVPALKNLSANVIDKLRNRVALVKKLEMYHLECIVRDYHVPSGSMFKNYDPKTGVMMDHNVGVGLKGWDKYKNPIYTPSTKAEEGHDVNITRAMANEVLVKQGFMGYAQDLENSVLDAFRYASTLALSKGIILVDTKVEKGEDADGNELFGDETYTPDSSRYIAVEEYDLARKEGRDPKSLDKDPVRKLVRPLVKEYEDRKDDLPQMTLELAAEDVRNTVETYTDLYFNLVGPDYNPSATKQLNAVRKEYGFRSR